MLLNKLQEALEEIAIQRKALDGAETQLRKMVSSLSGGNVAAAITPNLNTKHIDTARERDRLDDIIDILRREGSPMHVNQICEQLSQDLGKEFKRVDIEPGLNRHVNKSKRKRIEKFGPSMYGLPEWKSQRSLLAETA